MSQNINQNNIIIKEKDSAREKLFKEAYGLSVCIRATNILDTNNDWVQCILNFKDSLGKNYGLIEYFKEGKDNSTNYVELEYESDKEYKVKHYDKFIDAELEMVKIMKDRINGNIR